MNLYKNRKERTSGKTTIFMRKDNYIHEERQLCA